MKKSILYLGIMEYQRFLTKNFKPFDPLELAKETEKIVTRWSDEAKERNIEVIKVDPKSTSSKCPICGDKLVEDRYRILRCRRCNFIGDRDVIATINLYFKYSRCGVYGVVLNAPKPDENRVECRGIRMRQ
jgi:transposase